LKSQKQETNNEGRSTRAFSTGNIHFNGPVFSKVVSKEYVDGKLVDEADLTGALRKPKEEVTREDEERLGSFGVKFK
jgi:hypothetical protein